MSDALSKIPFLIVRDYKENRQKCTVSPLRGQDGFRFVDLPHPSRSSTVETIPPGILLSVDAPELQREDCKRLDAGCVTLIDSTWARLSKVLQRVRLAPNETTLPRSLPRDVVSAYPRVSKLYDDPRAGLASIEAVFAVTVILGKPDLGVIEHYRWAAEFLEQNHLTWKRLGWNRRTPNSPPID